MLVVFIVVVVVLGEQQLRERQRDPERSGSEIIGRRKSTAGNVIESVIEKTSSRRNGAGKKL